MICVIPARGGSVRIPRKNIKEFHGQPIILYSIQLAHKMGFDKIIVSTDDAEIEEIALAAGADIHPRPVDDGVMGTQEIAAMVLEDEWVRSMKVYDYCCVLYATAPLLEFSNLLQGINMLKTRDYFEYTMSVDQDGNQSGGFYWGDVGAFMERVPLDGNVLPFFTGDIDIDTPDDWARAERLYEERYGSGRILAG